MSSADDTAVADAVINTSTIADSAAATAATAIVAGHADDHSRSQHGSAAGHGPPAAPSAPGADGSECELAAPPLAATQGLHVAPHHVAIQYQLFQCRTRLTGTRASLALDARKTSCASGASEK